MAINTKEIGKMIKKKGMEFSNGLIKTSFKGNGIMTKYKEKGF